MIIFWGSPAEAFQSLLSFFAHQISFFVSDYCSEPYGRKTTQIVSELLIKSSKARYHFHPASHTILDLEQTVNLAGFKNPKSMKDIEKIFASTFSKDEHGFFQIPKSTLTSKFKTVPTSLDIQTLSENFTGEIPPFHR